MGYKVLLPTAGVGARLENMTKFLNKSLVSIAGKPALARIIDMFPESTEFVIPIGYKAELIKEFTYLAYPRRKFYFSKVNPFEGAGSGLGLSILTCKQYLQEPFIFCSCDTLVMEKIPSIDCNWMGYGKRNDISLYRTLQCHNGKVVNINEKGKIGKNIHPYIGLAGIYDYKKFWNAMEKGKDLAISQGEVFGFRKLLEEGVKAYKFTWMDTGVKNELEKTRSYYAKADAPNILEKENEAIWFLDQQVIKYSDDLKFIADRVKRAELLEGFIPRVIDHTQHMYSYSYVDGIVMSKCATMPIFKELLSFSKSFWKKTDLDEAGVEQFHKDCLKFYKNKTYERVNLFYEKFHKIDGEESINDIPMPTLRVMLDNIDWDWVAKGLAGRFHGDFHFENILYGKEGFTFLDWRQNFGQSLGVGDIYYDFGKLLHGLIVCHELITKNKYWIEWTESEIHFELYRKQSLVNCERYFYEWLEQNEYDVKKVKVITALIFLNIAGLHHYPYGLMLYALGKSMIYG